MKMRMNDEADTVLYLKEIIVYRIDKAHLKNKNIYQIAVFYRLNELTYHDNITLSYTSKDRWEQAYNDLIDKI